jgi:L-ascorbate metabolism protein UlaG (beta-lactamase superfamily)
MKLTKYGHACFTVEKEGQLLVVDPGSLSHDYLPDAHTVAIVITHEHPDHFDPDTLAAIFDQNPDSLLIADQSIIDKMPGHKGQAVQAGDSLTIGAFQLQFYGGQHAVIHLDLPVIPNIGVLINDSVYYPGDSFVEPDRTVDVLAVPLGAPWLKAQESIDFLTKLRPRLAFPTHDGLLSEDGQAFGDKWLQQFANKYEVRYERIDGQTIDV